MTVAYLALGSNVGDRAGRLQEAVDGLARADGVEVTGVSRVYETEPVGGPEQGAYLNAVVAVETRLSPHRLLALAQRVETEAGREPDPARRERWGPRSLDVDVLLVGDEEVHDADLEVPHPRMHERAFVLAPLADLAPDLPMVRTARRSGGRARASTADGCGPGWPGPRWQGVRVTDVELVH